MDASEEDLPESWVKKQRRDGSFYYHNVMTGRTQDRSPNDLEGMSDVNADWSGVPAFTVRFWSWHARLFIEVRIARRIYQAQHTNTLVLYVILLCTYPSSSRYLLDICAAGLCM